MLSSQLSSLSSDLALQSSHFVNDKTQDCQKCQNGNSAFYDDRFEFPHAQLSTD